MTWLIKNIRYLIEYQISCILGLSFDIKLLTTGKVSLKNAKVSISSSKAKFDISPKPTTP